jgi:hypothetical protein
VENTIPRQSLLITFFKHIKGLIQIFLVQNIAAKMFNFCPPKEIKGVQDLYFHLCTLSPEYIIISPVDKADEKMEFSPLAPQRQDTRLV